jgi:signal transduction histidine kinase
VRRVDDARVVTTLVQAVDDLDDTIKDIRRSIFALSSLGDQADIQAEVTRIVDQAAQTLPSRPSLRFEGPVRTLISADLAPDLLAVLRESLSNISRHAGATNVEVQLTARDAVTLTVVDDGKGIASRERESGLANMRRRAEARGGTMILSSEPGRGTSITWSVPL